MHEILLCITCAVLGALAVVVTAAVFWELDTRKLAREGKRLEAIGLGKLGE